ncbi:MAG: c-type cytochrome [Pikeienuella sp.]
MNLTGPNQYQTRHQALRAAPSMIALAILTFPQISLALDDLQKGAKLYQENCASCHGENLEGEPNWREQNPDGSMKAPPHDDTGHTWHHPDEMLFTYTKLGGEETLRQMGVTGVKSGMPPFSDILTDEEIALVLNFIKTNWSERSAKYQSELTEQNQ